MRHLKAGKRLGVSTSHRKAMMRNLVTSLLEHGQIRTTVTRAKEMRRYADKMIGLAKRSAAIDGGDLHAKRQALSFLKSKAAYQRLFEEYGSLFAERNGGYTRIYKLGNRLGDNAEMALIELIGVGSEEESTGKPAAPKAEAIKEVQADLKEEAREAAPAKESTKAEAAKEEAPAEEPEAAEEEKKEAKDGE